MQSLKDEHLYIFLFWKTGTIPIFFGSAKNSRGNFRMASYDPTIDKLKTKYKYR